MLTVTEKKEAIKEILVGNGVPWDKTNLVIEEILKIVVKKKDWIFDVESLLISYGISYPQNAMVIEEILEIAEDAMGEIEEIEDEITTLNKKIQLNAGEEI